MGYIQYNSLHIDELKELCIKFQIHNKYGFSTRLANVLNEKDRKYLDERWQGVFSPKLWLNNCFYTSVTVERTCQWSYDLSDGYDWAGYMGWVGKNACKVAIHLDDLTVLPELEVKERRIGAE